MTAIVVHGGAGHFADERVGRVRDGCRQAAAAGFAVLAQGGAALDAAQAAVRALEDDPEFNAGHGAVLTRAGTAEMDAALMCGATSRFGAIAAMANARNAIDIARAVLDDGEHVLLCAGGAWDFARERGFAPADAAAIVTERARERLARAAAEAGRAVPERDPGTVGACAIDSRGHVAAATSTGGMTYKRPGRIGDTPLCGCGTFASGAGAASATGEGEAIIRITMTRFCVDAMARGLSAEDAAWAAIDELGDKVGGEGGIICVDSAGRVGAAHNASRMAFASVIAQPSGELLTRDGVSIARAATLANV